MPDLKGIVLALLALVKGLWGSSTKQKTTVVEPEPDVKVTDGKADKDRLNDCGL